MSQLYADRIDSNLVNSYNRLIIEEEMETHASNPLKHLFAGAMAGAVSRTISAPFDRIKVLLQVQGAQLINIRACFQHMQREGGVRSFWRGNGINVMKIAPELAFKFMFYDEIKLTIHGATQRDLTLFERIISGSVAGALSQTIIYPMEVLKTRLCLRKTGQYDGAIDALTKIYNKEGMKAFFRGYYLNILGVLPYSGVDLAIYETLKNLYIKGHPSSNNRPPALICSICGIISSSIGVSIVYPLALLKTRVQASSCKTPVIFIFRKIVTEEGYLGLYRGIIATYMKVVPAVSMSYLVYEYTIAALGTSMS